MRGEWECYGENCRDCMRSEECDEVMRREGGVEYVFME